MTEFVQEENGVAWVAELQRKRSTVPAHSETTVAIATFNRTPLLRNSLQRMTERTIPHRLIVIDDGGSDGCEDLVVEARGWGLPIEYVYNHRPYKAMCSQPRNLATRMCETPLIVFTEPELLWDTDALPQMWADRANREADEFITAGTIRHGQAPGETCWCCGELYHVTKNWQAVWCGMFERQWLTEVRGLDEHFPQGWGWDDVDLGTRLGCIGVGQYVDLDIVATHQWHPPTIEMDQTPNETHFKSKNLDPSSSDNVIVANDENWGLLVPRPGGEMLP